MPGEKTKKQRTHWRNPKERIWIYFAVISMSIYIVWRLFFTLPGAGTYGKTAFLCGILLLITEIVTMLEGTEHFLRLDEKKIPEKPVIPMSWYPHVDVFIITHSEEASLVYKAVNGCLHMNYPDKKKVHIYICDDSGRPEIASLAQKMHVGYCALKKKNPTRAENINNALSMTNSPWVVSFDANVIPTRRFLTAIIPYIFLPRMKKLDTGEWVERCENERDSIGKIGFIQTPQSFYNPDLFQFNFYSEKKIPHEQDFFFREINVRRNSANAAIYSGSNTLINRQALEDVGGITTDSIGEAFETGIHIQERGYICYAVPEVLAQGLAPTDVKELLKQRILWKRGCIDSLRRVHIITNPHLSTATKISYLSYLMYWQTFSRRLICIFTPIIFVLLDIPTIVCDLKELLIIWIPSFLSYNHALQVTSGRFRIQRWSHITDISITPYLLLPRVSEALLNKRTSSKNSSTALPKSDIWMAIPHIVILVLDLLALLTALRSAIFRSSFGNAILVYWLAFNGLSLIMSIIFMSGRKTARSNDRFYVQIPVKICYETQIVYGETNDISESGLSLITDAPVYLPHGKDRMEIFLKTETYQAKLVGKVVRVDSYGDSQWKYGIKITDMAEDSMSDYYQMLYDRHQEAPAESNHSVNVFNDIYVNIHKRLRTGEHSRRELPRVPLDIDLMTDQGNYITVHDCNYEYIMINNADALNLPKTLSLTIPGCTMTMHCTASESKEGLYIINNWKELLFGEAFDVLFSIRKNDREDITWENHGDSP